MKQMGKRIALYMRVSTDDQTVENQLEQLKAWADRAGHEVVKVFHDQGISGAKGRDKRPGLDAMLKAATRREFDQLAVWSLDRLGRSLRDLLDILSELQGSGREIYFHTQAIDTTNPTGKAMFQMLGVFAELERSFIAERVRAGVARAQKHGTRSGNAIGRPSKISTAVLAAVKEDLGQGVGILKTARKYNLGTGTVQKVKAEMEQRARINLMLGL